MEKLVYPYTRHMFCERCEEANRPFKKQKGITLHLLRMIKHQDGFVQYGAVCVLCGCKAIPHTNRVQILREKTDVIPVKEWNALILLKPDEDGFVD